MVHAMPERRKDNRGGNKSKDLFDLTFETERYTPISLPFFNRDAEEDVTDAVKQNRRPLGEWSDEATRTAGKVFIDEEGRTRQNQLFVLQLPSVLPSVTVSDKHGNQEGAFAPASIDKLPQGTIGKLVVHKSGRVRLKIGNLSFNVDQGADCKFAQQVMCTHGADVESSEVVFLPNESLEGGHEYYLPKVVVTPDVESIVHAANVESDIH
mmetsp:Transcript_102207/g.234251  ORF Transcript_102207/g.234251 Transcript_102207/m.234251 type:complete len:210 (-) Transcript_102207:1574-2203(-)